MSENVRLVDDGTLDTVVECSLCGEQARYNFIPDSDDESYDREWALDDFAADHSCEKEGAD